MVINFDEYKDDEPITIIEHGVSKTYVHSRVLLSYNPCFSPTNSIYLEIIGEDVVYEKRKNMKIGKNDKYLIIFLDK